MSKPHRKARRARQKRYVPRPVRTPMLVGADLVLRPLMQIIDQIELHGTVDTDARGVPQFLASDGRWYDSASAIEGVIWHFEMMATRHSLALPLDGLRELHIALKFLVPVRESTLIKLRSDMPKLQRALALGNPDDQIDLVQQTRIKEALESRA